ncbi:MAG: hypothetical protein R3C54_15405 [Parvularculaceae bacterium]
MRKKRRAENKRERDNADHREENQSCAACQKKSRENEVIEPSVEARPPDPPEVARPAEENQKGEHIIVRKRRNEGEEDRKDPENDENDARVLHEGLS